MYVGRVTVNIHEKRRSTKKHLCHIKYFIFFCLSLGEEEGKGGFLMKIRCISKFL